MTLDAAAQLESVFRTSMAQAMDQVRERFRQASGTGRLQLVFWGTGALARVALQGLRRAGLSPVAVCDRDPGRWGASFEGMTILPPAEALDRFGSSALFIPAVYTNRELLEDLTARGVRALPLSVLAWQFPDAMLPHCALDLPLALHRERAQAVQAMGLWADARSRREYLGQVQWRASLDGSLLTPALPSADMFNPTDLISFLPEEHFVDCGAFDGDSIRNHLRHHPGGRGPITAIEPDPITFQRLLAFLDSQGPGLRARVRPIQAALGAARGTISFRATGGVGSSRAAQGEAQVRLERLDDLAEAASATFLKMDIEGAEQEALEGARSLLRKAMPVLGICLYHRPEDLWRVPLLIHAICPDYRLFLRRYSDECWEQVCYAIPPGRLKGEGLG